MLDVPNWYYAIASLSELFIVINSATNVVIYLHSNSSEILQFFSTRNSKHLIRHGSKISQDNIMVNGMSHATDFVSNSAVKDQENGIFIVLQEPTEPPKDTAPNQQAYTLQKIREMKCRDIGPRQRLSSAR